MSPSDPRGARLAEPAQGLRQGIANASASLVCGITQGLGWQLVNANLPAIQGSLGASAAEATWLTTAYFSTAITSIVLGSKVRLHYGLHTFANAAAAAFLAIAVLHLFTTSLPTAIAVRAAHGVAAAPLAMMAIFYMVQAFPPRLMPAGVVLGLGTLQLGAPLARLASQDLLEIGQWHGLYLLDVALALLTLAAINAVRLEPMPRQDALSRGDFISFPLWAAAVALLCVVVTQGPQHWWRDAPWLGVCLAAAIACLGLFAAVELNRERPMLNLGWITSPYVLRLVATVIVFRLVISEQAAVIALLGSLGLSNDQLHGLQWLVLSGTAAGLFAAIGLALRASPTAAGVAAAALIAAGAWIDSQSSALTRVPEVLVSQALLAAGASMFFGVSVLVGFGHVARQGMKDAISFFAIFPAAQFIGSLLGTAWVTTFVADRRERNLSALAEHLTLADPVVAMRVARQGIGAFAQDASREATLLAYNQLFQIIAAIAMAIVAWLLALALGRRLFPATTPKEAP
jgi:MFS family permease